MRPNGTFYSELRVGGFRLTIGTYDTSELAARVRCGRVETRAPRRDFNFPDVASIAEGEFLTPPRCLILDKDCRRHRHASRRLLIVEHNERWMQQWCESFPGDVRGAKESYAMKR
jgi:hypothetical protein